MKKIDNIVLELTHKILVEYASNQRSLIYEGTFDAGPAILASLFANDNSETTSEISKNALTTWLDDLKDTSSFGSFGGLSAVFVGLNMASSFYPRLFNLSEQVQDSLKQAVINLKVADRCSWSDYDLISGPSGIILSLYTAAGKNNVSSVIPAALHLSSLCKKDDLESLRIYSYQEDELRSWNFQKINTGLAHGVTGIVAALNKAAELNCNGESIVIKTAIKNLSRWLMDESFIDEWGLITWSPAAIEKGAKPTSPSTRQAWCYGTPGIAWTLYESSCVLNDNMMKTFAENAMRSYCNLFHEERYLDREPLDSNLGICHGAAGILLIADAFEKYAGLNEAAILGNRLENYLLDRSDEIVRLSAENMTLLTGASGILSALIARQGGNRDWLAQLGLR